MDNSLIYDLVVVICTIVGVLLTFLAARFVSVRVFSHWVVRIVEFSTQTGLFKHENAFRAIKWLVEVLKYDKVFTDEKINELIKGIVDVYNKSGTFDK